MENVESQARPQTAIRHPKLAMVSMLLGAFVGMSPAQTAALNALSGREAGDGSAQARFTAGAHVGFYFTLALIIIALMVATQLKGRPVGHSIKLNK